MQRKLFRATKRLECNKIAMLERIIGMQCIESASAYDIAAPYQRVLKQSRRQQNKLRRAPREDCF
jgi:hypothetical protein